MNYLNMLNAATHSALPMPDPRQLNIDLLPTGREGQFYLDRFMERFNAGPNETALVQARTGLHTLAVSGLMFEDHKTGKSKIEKRGRAPYLLHVAETVLDPDEIRLHQGGHGERALYFLSRFLIKREVMNIFAVFNQDGEMWTGWTGYQDRRPEYLELKRRGGVLLYRRPEM